MKHRRSFLKKMGLKKSPFDGFRSTDMALAATAVAATTVRCSSFSEGLEHGRRRAEALFGHLFESSEADVRAAGVMFGDIFMALTAGRRSVWIGGVFYHSFMRGFPVRVIGVAAVALFTAELTVIFVFCKFTVHVYFFMRSQRLHISTSALTLCFGRLCRLALIRFCNFPGYLDQFARIRMAGKAMIFICCDRHRQIR